MTTDSKYASKLTLIGGLFSRRLYAQFSEYYGQRYMFYSTLFFGALATLVLSFAIYLGVQYTREQRLMHGARTLGKIVALEIRPDKDKSRTVYRTAVSYTFEAQGNRKFSGSANRRLDIKPDFVPSGTIDVVYDEANPALNTIGAGLTEELNDTLFGTWAFTIAGVFFGVYVARYLQWRSARRGDNA